MKRLASFLLAAALLVPGAASARTPRRGFDLFFTAENVLLHANRVLCNINNAGEWCVDANNSPTFGGGFWPAGTSVNRG